MSASQVRPIMFDDPALVWLDYHGERNGFRPDESPYDFLTFIGEKGRQFQEKYTKEVLSGAVRVCEEGYEVRSADKLRETLALMDKGTPIISQAALWWAPDRVYGVPDFLVHTSWLRERFPRLLTKEEAEAVPTKLGDAAKGGHYIVFETKFTTKLEDSQKTKDLENYKAQLRIYSYILGRLQGVMPKKAFLATRDHLFDPHSVSILSQPQGPLDRDLADLRDQFVEIKINGEKYAPWKDAIVAFSLSNSVERWDSAKNIIASEKVPGGDPELVYQITGSVKRELAGMGYSGLDSLLKEDAAKIPLERCKGIGSKRARQIRAILSANRSRDPVTPSLPLVPKAKEFEFYVDFEYFTNVNVDFEAQWPDLQGCEMIFMVGLGSEEAGSWSFETLVSAAEDQNQERKMFEGFLELLQTRTDGAFLDKSRTAFYHWTSAEVWQAARASDRHGFPQQHPLRNLPWCDLHKIFLEGPAALPGSWSFALKDVARALSQAHPEYATVWPGDLDKGLRAMVMGWRTYQRADPLMSAEMDTLKTYLDADCRALWHVLKWLRHV